MLCHIFKTGEHTDSNGNKKFWSTDDLDKICYQFYNVHSAVPICVGHPVSNSPAYGWIKDVKRIGQNLYCTFKDVQEEFKQAIKRGIFKNRSISLDKDFNIRHLAFLGAQAPAIKGLEMFCFADCELRASSKAVDKGNQRNGVELCDPVCDTAKPLAKASNQAADCEARLKAGESSTAETPSNPSNQAADCDFNSYSFSDFQDKEENMENTFEQQLKAKDDEIFRLKSLLDEKEKAEKIKNFEDFAQKAISNGNISPKYKDSVINLLSVCDRADAMNFSDNNENLALNAVKKFISQVKIINFEDIATPATANEKSELKSANDYAKELEKIMKEEKVDLTTAFAKLNR